MSRAHTSIEFVEYLLLLLLYIVSQEEYTIIPKVLELGVSILRVHPTHWTYLQIFQVTTSMILFIIEKKLPTNFYFENK